MDQRHFSLPNLIRRNILAEIAIRRDRKRLTLVCLQSLQSEDWGPLVSSIRRQLYRDFDVLLPDSIESQERDCLSRLFAERSLPAPQFVTDLSKALSGSHHSALVFLGADMRLTEDCTYQILKVLDRNPSVDLWSMRLTDDGQAEEPTQKPPAVVDGESLIVLRSEALSLLTLPAGKPISPSLLEASMSQCPDRAVSVFPHPMAFFEGFSPARASGQDGAKSGFTAKQLFNEPISYVGFFRGVLGLGQAARMYVSSLNAVGVQPQLIDISWLANFSATDFPKPSAAQLDLGAAKVVVFHFNAETFSSLQAETRLIEAAKDSYVIGAWAWEALEFPDEFCGFLSYVNEVWALSDFTAEILRQKASVPVLTIPIAIEVPDVTPDRKRFSLDEDEFVFLFNFDYNSHSSRKNPDLVIQAFAQAFNSQDQVRLMIKSINGGQHPQAALKLAKAAQGLKVTFLDEALSSDERFVLLNSCDAYVSLHRAEGFGLGMAEAMAYGKAVIGTGWSGNMIFMNPNNSYLVDFTMEPLEEVSGPYLQGTLWAQPSLDSAIEQMVIAWQDNELRAKKSVQAKEDIAILLNEETVGSIMLERLLEIQKGIEGKIPLASRPSTNDPARGRVGPYVFLDLLRRPTHYLRRVPWLFKVLRKDGLRGLRFQTANVVRDRLKKGI